MAKGLDVPVMPQKDLFHLATQMRPIILHV